MVLLWSFSDRFHRVIVLAMKANVTLTAYLEERVLLDDPTVSASLRSAPTCPVCKSERLTACRSADLPPLKKAATSGDITTSRGRFPPNGEVMIHRGDSLSQILILFLIL